MAVLTDAVSAYRAALEEYTRARVPLDWAATQNKSLDRVLGGSVVTVDHNRVLEGAQRTRDSPDAHVIVCGNRLPSLRN
jgi:hypothetical protein